MGIARPPMQANFPPAPMGPPQVGMMPQRPPVQGPPPPGHPVGLPPPANIGMPPNMMPPQPGPPPPGMHPPVNIGPPMGPPLQAPAPHVNPAFFPPNSQPMPMGGPPRGVPLQIQQVPPADPYGRPPVTYPPAESYSRPLPDSRHDPMIPQISEVEFDEILQRNKTVSSSAISRAVQDASAGDYANAIETLVTAISLIKGSKIANDDRCRILITSLAGHFARHRI
ncbi:hypothetical protein LSAT2_010640 [Lamellibrachia satsuma]|nr:hypothetical protein LSAT2_010640 [Lamellibrachia satsuma]